MGEAADAPGGALVAVEGRGLRLGRRWGAENERTLVEKQQIVELVVRAIESANLGRTVDQRLDATPTAVLFGAPSPLDSLGLVALLIDIEEAFQKEGHALVLSDERAMSQRRSPFRDVPSLTAYIEQLISGGVA
jgi:hypothetical protein